VYVENHQVAGLDPNDPIAISHGDKIGVAMSAFPKAKT
jgi:hypothetical protein